MVERCLSNIYIWNLETSEVLGKQLVDQSSLHTVQSAGAVTRFDLAISDFFKGAFVQLNIGETISNGE